MANKGMARTESTIYQCGGELEFPDFTNQFSGQRSEPVKGKICMVDQLQLSRQPLTHERADDPVHRLREIRDIDRQFHLPGFLGGHI